MTLSRIVRRCMVAASLALSGLVVPNAGATIVLNVSAGILTGASGVTVSGFSGTFSVNFVDGTCTGVFGGCDSSNFLFQTQAAATAASQALLDSVFVDSFDSNPALTRGCSATPGFTNDYCEAITPYSSVGFLRFASAVNHYPADVLAAPDTISSGLGDSSVDYSQQSARVLAVWSVDVPVTVPPNPSVPEPGSLALLGLAGAALAWAQRRRQPGGRVQ